MPPTKRKQVRGSYDSTGVWVSAAEKREHKESYGSAYPMKRPKYGW